MMDKDTFLITYYYIVLANRNKGKKERKKKQNIKTERKQNRKW